MEHANGGDLLAKIKEHKLGNLPFKEGDIWKIAI